MKLNKLSDLSLEQLESKKKTVKSLAIGLGIVIIIACSVLFYVAMTSENFALIAVAVGSLMSLMPIFISISQINAEIKSRKSKYL
ncbi:hypothetical protein [Chryseobacterium sp. GP-SGM7]|uniref:hypothetical protein n=1 Tax=Chryseobacterium sp. GP-SGM7 TaxID=3411323 RepID=UPI003B93AAFA